MHDRVVVAVDPRAPGSRAVEEAAVLARSHGAELVVVVAYPTQLTVAERRARDGAPFDQQWRLSPGSSAEVAAGEAVRRARAFAGDARIRTRCEPGRPAAVLPAVSVELGADLLVVELTGTHGPSAITPRVARALERKAPCAVVVVADGPDAGLVVPAPDPDAGIDALPA